MAINYFLQQQILGGIEETLKKVLPDYLKFNYYMDGLITTDNGNGTYSVKVNDDTWTLKAKDGKTFVANDVVLIMIPNGNESNAFIDCKRP